MKSATPAPAHQEIRDDLIAMLRNKADATGIPAEEVLAIVANTVGQLMALQDQTKYTKDQIINLVVTNIEAGNAHALAKIKSAGGTAN